MAYPTELVAGDQLTAATANDYLMNPTLTAGETITATGAPKAVYIKAADSKVYKASAATQAHVDGFIGFVVLDSSANDLRRVLGPGKTISGLSGLTVGAPVYLGDTAGAVSVTPGTIALQVGIAISTSAMLIIRPISILSGISANVTAAGLNEILGGGVTVKHYHKFASGNTSVHSEGGTNPQTTTTTITCGFTARFVRIIMMYGTAESIGSSDGSSNRCIYRTPVPAAAQSNSYAWNNVAAGGGTPSDTGTISNITATTFDVVNNAGGATHDVLLLWEAYG